MGRSSAASDVSGVAVSMNGSKDVPQSRIQTQRKGALSMLTRLKPSSICPQWALLSPSCGQVPA